MKYLLKLLFLASITTFSAGLLWSDEITSKLYEKYKSSIVRVWAGFGHGTGFVINDDGYILTNAHVTALNWNVFDDNTSNSHEEHMTGVDADNLCPNKKRHYVVLREVGGKAYGYRARLIAESRHLDLAILKVDEPLKDCKPLRFFGENSVPKHGESIFTVGHSGMNDDEQKTDNLIKYMGIEFPSAEYIVKYARSVINREFDEIPPEVLPKSEAKAIKELIFKLYYKTQLTREEQNNIQKLNLEHILKHLIQKASTEIVNHMSLQNFVATESCPPIKELPEEFFDLASPACGNAGDIEKIVKVQHWGLDNNGSVLILQHKATTRQGNSGGPMLNMRGEVVGVVTSGRSNDGVNTGLNYASHGDEAMAFLKEKGIKFYRGAGAPNTDIANISLQEKFEAAFGKLIIPKTHEIINGVIVSAKGHMIVPWKENADYSDSILIHKIGEYSFAYKMVPLASDSAKRLTLLKPLAEIKDIPFLELSRKEFDKKTQYTIAQQNVNANTLLSDLGVGDFKKIEETLKDGEKINEAAKKQFELKKESATLKSRSKPFFILSGSTMHGAPVIDAANNMAGFIVGASNGGNVALPAAAVRKILEANGVLEASEDVSSYDISSLFWEDYLKIGAVVVLVCLAILLLVSLARKRSNSLNSQFLTKLENNGANVARHDVEAKSVYIPQKVLEYGTPDLKAKISAAENVIHQIDRILNNPSKIDGINVYKVAREYQQLQQNAIKRLSRCLTLAGLNRKREALQMASAYPSLISIINSLQFDDLEKWRIYCARAGIPAPEQILNSDIEKLNSLIEEMKLMPEDHTQILRKYMAGGEFEKAIELLEIDIALNPNNEALQRQLVSVKNNLLNQKISIISKHAQNGEHKEAVAIFDQINEIMPQSLKDSSTRWPKMLSYIVSVKRDIAKDIIAETMKALQETDKEDWRKIFDILSVIDANVEGFPDLKDDINFEITAKKRAEAEEGKAAYVKQMEFEDACGELNKMVSNLSELRDKGKVSKADLLYYLRAAEIKWKKAESYGIEIGEDIANRFSKNIKFVKQEINRIDTIKRRCILSSVGTMVILVASISVILYNRHHKLNAYKEFMSLYRGNDTAETLTSVFTSLKNKYSSYLEHPNFKRIVDDIAGKIGVEKQMESDFKSFVEKCSNPIEETPDSSRVKLLESWIESEYAKLDSHLPQSFKMKLKLSKDRFDGELKKYKIYITHYAEGERDKLLSEINSIFNSITSDFSKGIYDGEKSDNFSKKKKTFADLKYEYVDNVSFLNDCTIVFDILKTVVKNHIIN